MIVIVLGLIVLRLIIPEFYIIRADVWSCQGFLCRLFTIPDTHIKVVKVKILRLELPDYTYLICKDPGWKMKRPRVY